MASGPFRIIEHVVPCQHIREYPRAISTEQEEVLHLSVKQYIPVDNPNPQPGDITILGAHANAFPKELYEPLWEEIYLRSKQHGFRIRGIWIADVAHQGHSSVLNEEHLGNDPSWFDHARDLMHLINLKRAEMPRPIFGIGHSMGGAQLVNVALMHPRLITSLILLDPVINSVRAPDGEFSFHTIYATIPPTTKSSTHRRDLWPSRQAAADALRKNKFYQKWDPRVLDRWIKYGLRDVPTALYPNKNEAITSSAANSSSEQGLQQPQQQSGPPVTLTTPRHQEVFTFSRPNYAHKPPEASDKQDPPPPDRITHPDLDHNLTSGYPFYRPEAPLTFTRLPHLRPSVMYIFAEESDISFVDFREAKMKSTGVGVGGSGGAAEGRVASHLLPNTGHLIAMEAVGAAADVSATWLGSEMERWRADEEAFRAEWDRKSKVEKMTIDEEWVKHVPPPVRRGNNGANNSNSNGNDNSGGGAGAADSKAKL